MPRRVKVSKEARNRHQEFCRSVQDYVKCYEPEKARLQYPQLVYPESPGKDSQSTQDSRTCPAWADLRFTAAQKQPGRIFTNYEVQSVLCAMGLGTGKTLTAIRTAYALREANLISDVIVITNTALIPEFYKELDRCRSGWRDEEALELQPTTTARASRRSRRVRKPVSYANDYNDDVDFEDDVAGDDGTSSSTCSDKRFWKCFVNHNYVQSDKSEFRNQVTRDSFVIIDEAHNMITGEDRSLQPKIGLYREWLKNAKYVMAMTATPVHLHARDADLLVMIIDTSSDKVESLPRKLPTKLARMAKGSRDRVAVVYDYRFDPNDFPERTDFQVDVTMDDEHETQVRSFMETHRGHEEFVAANGNSNVITDGANGIVRFSNKIAAVCAEVVRGHTSAGRRGLFRAALFTRYLEKGVQQIQKCFRDEHGDHVIVADSDSVPVDAEGDKLVTDKLVVLATDKEVSQEVLAYYDDRAFPSVAIVFTSKAATGVNLRRTQQMHIVDAVHGQNEEEQAIGRAIRRKGHKDLPLDQQYTDVYHWQSVYKDSADESPEQQLWSKRDNNAKATIRVMQDLMHRAKAYLDDDDSEDESDDSDDDESDDSDDDESDDSDDDESDDSDDDESDEDSDHSSDEKSDSDIEKKKHKITEDASSASEGEELTDTDVEQSNIEVASKNDTEVEQTATVNTEVASKNDTEVAPVEQTATVDIDTEVASKNDTEVAPVEQTATVDIDTEVASKNDTEVAPVEQIATNNKEQAHSSDDEEVEDDDSEQVEDNSEHAQTRNMRKNKIKIIKIDSDNDDDGIIQPGIQFIGSTRVDDIRKQLVDVTKDIEGETIEMILNMLASDHPRADAPLVFGTYALDKPTIRSRGPTSIPLQDAWRHHIVLLPVHIPGHWVAVRLDLRQADACSLHVYDSMGSNYYKRNTQKYIRKVKKEIEKWGSGSITVTVHAAGQRNHPMPKQKGSDCGVWTCFMIEHLYFHPDDTELELLRQGRRWLCNGEWMHQKRVEMAEMTPQPGDETRPPYQILNTELPLYQLSDTSMERLDCGRVILAKSWIQAFLSKVDPMDSQVRSILSHGLHLLMPELMKRVYGFIGPDWVAPGDVNISGYTTGIKARLMAALDLEADPNSALRVREEETTRGLTIYKHSIAYYAHSDTSYVPLGDTVYAFCRMNLDDFELAGVTPGCTCFVYKRKHKKDELPPRPGGTIRDLLDAYIADS